MPPVAMSTVVLPAFIASRTSIHVISSIQTVSGGVTGLAVSTQLYAFARDWPPAALRGSGAGRWPPRPPRPWSGGCADAIAAIARTIGNKNDRFIQTPGGGHSTPRH